METALKKNTVHILEIALTLTALLFTIGCSKHKVTLTLQQTTTQQLEVASPWKIQSVSNDGVDQTAQFTGMTLKFTDANYTTTNGEPLWATSGSWSFDDATAKTFKRNDDIDVEITAISATGLTLSLQWNEDTYTDGRINSTKGKYVFVFVK